VRWYLKTSILHFEREYFAKNIIKLLLFPTTRLCEPTCIVAMTERSCILQLSLIVPDVKLISSSQQPYRHTEKSTRRNLYTILLIDSTETEVLYCYFICIKAIKISMWSAFPFFLTLPISPTQKQVWSSMKYFSLENCSRNNKVWEALVCMCNSSSALDTASLDNQKVNCLRQILHR